uniref:DRIM domain-containing protein n=1 Tax=Echinostoma caproni TaxID=27848 RepID=A0A183A136_9TREM
LAFTVSRLSLAERSAAVRAILGRYGKVLDESGFRNQLSLLVNKRGADIPFYLKLACEELRLYGTYEELDTQLKQLPDTVPSLVRHIVARAEAQSGSELVLITLALLACSRKPLTSVELHSLLDSWLADRQGNQKGHGHGPSWKDLLTSFSSESEDLDSLNSLQQKINHLILEDSASYLKDSSKLIRVPSLAFHILLSGIRPLLAGLGDQEENLGSEDLVSPNRELGLIRLRNPEVLDLIQDICFNLNKKSLSSFSQLGYHKPTITTLSTSLGAAKRLRPTSEVEEPNEAARKFCGTVDRRYIHWLLATRLPGLEHKIYHFVSRISPFLCSVYVVDQ